MFPDLPPMSATRLVLVLLLLALPILPNFYSIWHCFHRQFPTANEKVAWLLTAVFVPVLGGIAYLIFGRKRGRKLS